MGIDSDMPEDYKKVLTKLDNAVKQQREHALAMLANTPPAGMTTER